MEAFAIPGAGGIIERLCDGVRYILIQERFKENAPLENGLLEIPAGKIREFENIYDCLRREIWEETGLIVTEIEGEKEAVTVKSKGYKVLSYTPFASSQNIIGLQSKVNNYPIMVHTFICKVSGELLKASEEARNMRWVSLEELRKMLYHNESSFYPMHITALKKYLAERG